MQLSAEARWFRQTSDVSEWNAWFHSDTVHPCRAFEDSPRTDRYLFDPSNTELGIKRRGENSGVEIKCLVSSIDVHTLPSTFRSAIQLWGKWTSNALLLDDHALVSVVKRRHLRRYVIGSGNDRVSEVALSGQTLHDNTTRRRSDNGAFLELTEISLGDGAHWWTVGFESFGPREHLVRNLERVARHLTEQAPDNMPPVLDDWLAASYPAWLVRNT